MRCSKHMDKKFVFDEFAENYREIHTESVQGVSGVDSSYFGRQKVEIIKKDRGRLSENYELSIN
ncbi:MAG: hypothetical protein K2N87_16450 [Eubacterium sp.]|nr:hypothetical protein [Eubacterium sp.]